MKFLKTLTVSAGLLLPFLPIKAQVVPGAFSYHELGRTFSQWSHVGSARLMGAGGAQISLGGDISSALSNPAGLGFYNRSEISFTPSLSFVNADATYLGTLSRENSTQFNFDNIGVVFNSQKDELIPGSYKGHAFALSYSKVNDFNSIVSYRGSNTNNDILDYIVQDANFQDVAVDDLTSIPRNAYNAYLINEYYAVRENGGETPFYERTFFTEYPTSEFPTEQSEVIETEGSQNLLSLAYGGNVSDRFYFGGGINIANIRYNVFKSYQELYPSGSIVERSNIFDELRTNGTGLGLTFGVIGRPANWVTLGLSVMTPTWYAMSEEYFNSVSASYDNYDLSDYPNYFLNNENAIVPPGNINYDYIEVDTPPNEVLNNVSSDNNTFSIFDYNLTTPMRINGGATFFITKNGFLSADIEFVDYSNINLSGQGERLDFDNQQVSRLYTSTINYRVGGEYRYENFRVRGGFAYFGDPYGNSAQVVDGSRMNLTGGLGYRNSNFFIDVAGIYMMYDGEYAPYAFNANSNFTTNVVNISTTNFSLMASVGFFF
jgi:hypothetical protein